MPKVDKTAVSHTRIMGGGTLVVSMLGTKTPATSLPKGTVFNDMTRSVMVTFETVGELDLSSSALFTKYGVVFQTLFSFFDIGWTLGSENARDLIIMGGKEESGGGRGMRGKKVLLEVGVDGTGSKASLYYEQVSLSLSFLLV